MESTTVKISLPVDRNMMRFKPLPESTVRMPNDILRQVIQLGDLPSRKLFYLILAKDHLGEPERREYEIGYTDIYSSANNAKARGKEKKKVVRTGFQEKGFHVSAKFVREHLKTSADEPYINAFSMVDYVDNKFKLVLTPEFKLYLHVVRKYRNDVPYTTGDLHLLLGMYHRAADKLYWLIRSLQFAKGTEKYPIDKLKEALGYEVTENRNFCSQTLVSIQREMEGTWAEFGFRPIKKGREMRFVELTFDKDSVIENKLQNDLVHTYEVELEKRGFKTRYIHYIRSLILREEKTKSGRFWDSLYVLRTISGADNKKAAGQVKDLPAYLYDALFKGHFDDGLPSPHEDVLGRLGNVAVPPQAMECKAYRYDEVERHAKGLGCTAEAYKLWAEEKYGKGLDWVHTQSGTYLVERASVERIMEELKWLETVKALD